MQTLVIPTLLVCPGDHWAGRLVVAVLKRADHVVIATRSLTHQDQVSLAERDPRDRLTVSRPLA